MAAVIPFALLTAKVDSNLGKVSRFHVRKGDGFGYSRGDWKLGFGRNRGLNRLKMASNGYIGSGSKRRREGDGFENPKIYKRLDSCLIVPPVKRRRVRGVVQFLGGAFIGAVPEVTYRLICD